MIRLFPDVDGVPAGPETVITVVVFTLFNRVLARYMTTRHNAVVAAVQVINGILINLFPLKYKQATFYLELFDFFGRLNVLS